MKKILIVIHQMERGGVQIALINMLRVISRMYNVSLRCFSMSGSLINEIPTNVRVLKEEKKLIILGEKSSNLKHRSKLLFLKKMFFNLLSRIIGGIKTHRLYYKGWEENEEYDVVISYVQDVNGKTFSVGCNDYAIQCVKAKQKISFVHCDFQQYGGNDRINRSRYSFFDKIVCVSNSCKNRFVSCVSSKSNSTFVLRNFIDINSVISLSKNDTFVYDHNRINIISVSRLSEEKGIVEAVRAVVESNNNKICYYIVGDGPQKNIIQKIIKNNKSNNVFLLGEQNNPYKYMKNADYLLVPSKHEAAPMVFDEANALGLTIISTNTLSSREMLTENDMIIQEISPMLFANLQKPAHKKQTITNEKEKYNVFSLLLES